MSHKARMNLTRVCVITLLLGFGLVAYVTTRVESLGGTTDPIVSIHADILTTYQASATNVQSVIPLVVQRGVGIDGTLRAAPSLPMMIAGNPFESATGQPSLAVGTHGISDVDLALPSAGFSWVIGRSYNARQNNGSYVASNGYQGKNWFQSSQPEIVLYEGATDDKDVLYLVYGADRFLEYQREDATSDYFVGVNGAAGVFLWETGSPETYTLTDMNSNEITFLGFNTGSGTHDGQFWKMEDPAGNVAYVGDETTASTAITNGYKSTNGAITTAYDTAGRRYTYTYVTLTGVERLESVVAEVYDTSWVEVAAVDYEYYDEVNDTDVTEDDYGEDGDLKLVTVTRQHPDAGTGIEDVQVTYYRYWDDADTEGFDHALRLVVSPEGARRFDWTDVTFNEDFKTATNAALDPYGSAYYEYDNARRIVSAWFEGECGCGGAKNGIYDYEYHSNPDYTDSTGYDDGGNENWVTRTQAAHPDGSYTTYYFDEVAQGLSTVRTDIDPDSASPAPDFWVTYVERDTSGQVSAIHTPANVTAYEHDTTQTVSFTRAAGAGLVRFLTRETGSVATKGYVLEQTWADGATPSSTEEYYDSVVAYSTQTLEIGTSSGVYVVRPYVNSRKVFQAEEYTNQNADETTYSLTFHTKPAPGSEPTLAIKTVDAVAPAVVAAENGENVTATVKRYFELDGSLTFQKSNGGIVTYRAYDADYGYMTTQIEDADTASLSPPTGFSSSGTEIDRETTYSYDEQGRRTEVITANGQQLGYSFSVLADRRRVMLQYNDFNYDTVRAAYQYWGPIGYTVTNQAGGVEASATVSLANNTTTYQLAFHVDETDDDPIEAVGTIGSVVDLVVHEFADPGVERTKTSLYNTTPTTLPGVAGDHDDTTFTYDLAGRLETTTTPAGTISKTVYDAIGRRSSTQVGTDDGTPGDMVNVESYTYDDDGVGNSLVTKVTQYVNSTPGDDRVTNYDHDVRGRVKLETRAAAPHHLHEYDNLGRRVATGLYTSAPSATADPSATTTNRVGLTETSYDSRGRVWQSKNYPAGSASYSLTADQWYDDEGRIAKSHGASLEKYVYDRLGRRTHTYLLANVDALEDTYAEHTEDVVGDVVLEERHTVYADDSEEVLLEASIQRPHSATSTGALDTNGDADDLKYTPADVKGWIQITAHWYDTFHRRTDTVQYGTYGFHEVTPPTNFTRPSTPPARNATALRTTFAYSTAGRLNTVNDPKDIQTKYNYANGGRRTKVTRNYVDGTPNGEDEDRVTKYFYTDGLLAKIKEDLPGTTDDQETFYNYGVTSANSDLDSNDLLASIQYPERSTSELLKFEYNRQGEQISRTDQGGNNIDTTYDDLGRATVRTVDEVGTGFNDDVLRIEWAYKTDGSLETVMQYDAETAGAVVDAVKYTYEANWGLVSKIEQDYDSAVGTGTAYDVEFAYEKSDADGRNTVRRSSTTLPSGRSLTYTYTGDDDDASRVTTIKHGATEIAEYEYRGFGDVVRTFYDEPDVYSQFYDDANPGDYENLDRFGRVLTWQWGRLTGGTPSNVNFYDVEYTYDQNSNVASVTDNVHSGFDVTVSVDDLNRVTTFDSTAIYQDMTLTHTGGWGSYVLDLDDTAGCAGEDIDEDRTYNKENRLTRRDDQCTADAYDYTLTYDLVGNLTDDAENFEYEYDAFYRLVEVSEAGASTQVVSQYRYNGLGQRIGSVVDTDDDGVGDETWSYYVYDGGRSVATYLGNVGYPSEEFFHHDSGAGDGLGRRISVAARDVDGNGDLDFTDVVEDERYYYAENAPSVVAIVTHEGQMVEWVKYDAKGMPFGIAAGDADSSGGTDGSDVTTIHDWIVNGDPYDNRGDIDNDGDVDANDETWVNNGANQVALGWTELSGSGNPRGWRSLEFDSVTHLYSSGKSWFSPILQHIDMPDVPFDPGNVMDGGPAEGPCEPDPVLDPRPSPKHNWSYYECDWVISTSKVGGDPPKPPPLPSTDPCEDPKTQADCMFCCAGKTVSFLAGIFAVDYFTGPYVPKNRFAGTQGTSRNTSRWSQGMRGRLGRLPRQIPGAGTRDVAGALGRFARPALFVSVLMVGGYYNACEQECLDRIGIETVPGSSVTQAIHYMSLYGDDDAAEELARWQRAREAEARLPEDPDDQGIAKPKPHDPTSDPFD